MIPLKIVVEGFLKYHDKVEFDFTGQSLWMLYGPNGVGKSSVFDAMTYALFGEHREGAQKAEQLINQQADSFMVEFDFLIDQTHYRIRRTVAHNGRHTCHIFTVSDGNRIDPIPGTSTVRQFNEWIIQHIGLDYKAFTACILLRQGESDRLLNEGPSKRHEIIGQVINIQQYEALYKRAKQHHDDDERDIKRLRDELDQIEPITEANVETARLAWEAAVHQRQQCELEREILLRREGDVRRWNSLTDEHRNLTAEMEMAAQFLAQAEQIEHDFARYQVLERNVPALQKVVQCRTKLAQTEEAYVQASHEVRRIAEECNAGIAAHESLRQRLAQHRDERAQKDREERTCRQRQELLAPKITDLARLDFIHGQLNKIDTALAVYPLDLAKQLAAFHDEIEQARKAQVLIGPLSQFIRVRSRWQQAQANLRQANAALAAIQAQVPDNQSLETYARQCQDSLVRSDERMKDYRQRLAQLDRLDGKAQCEMCGQLLTPEHVHTERRRLQDQLHLEEQTQQANQARNTKMQDLWIQSQHQIKRQHQVQTAIQEQETVAHDALAALPASIRSKITVSDDLAQILSGTGYPSASDIDDLQQQARQIDRLQKQLDILGKQEQESHSLKSQRLLLADERINLERDYPPDLIAKIQQEDRSLKDKGAALRKEIDGLDATIGEEVNQEQRLSTHVATLKDAISAAKTAEAHYQRMRSSQNDELEEAVAQCPTELCSPLEVDISSLKQWEVEFVHLADASLAKQKLEADQAAHHRVRERLQQVQQEMDALDMLGHISLAEYELQCEESRLQWEVTNRAVHETQREYQKCRDIRQQRETKELQVMKVIRRASLWKRLMQMLDREHLQHYLLRQAEQSIVEFANATLDIISGYTLRLEIREESNQTFDLVAFDNNAGNKPIGMRLLSGSQKFRVAFSLAMGIGRYVTAGRQTPEAVFIDEGFGSLDQDGRQHIISEIANLARHLQRIILVSHQSEFAQAFPHAYHIYSDGGTSQARYVVLDDLMPATETEEMVLALAD